MTTPSPAIALDAPPPRSWRRMVRDVLVFSVGSTTLAAVAALVAMLSVDARFSVVFVVLRWCIVAVLLATPLVHQLTSRMIGWRLPWALTTPLTALVLTTESIAFDIISAQLH